jgi:hypothetical protein
MTRPDRNYGQPAVRVSRSRRLSPLGQPARWHRTSVPIRLGRPCRSHARTPRLRVSKHRILAAHLRPATPVDVKRQESAHLRRGCIKVTVAGQHHVCGIPGLGHFCFGAVPVTLGTEHRPQAQPARLACQRRRGEALPEPPTGLQGPRARISNSTTRPAIVCSVRFTDTRAVADGTDTNLDQAQATHEPARRSSHSSAETYWDTPPRVTSLRPLRLKGRPLAGYASDEGCAALATATAQYLLPR